MPDLSATLMASIKTPEPERFTIRQSTFIPKSRKFSSLAVEEAEVAIPSQRDNIYHKNSMMQWNYLEVDSLDKWPDHPILCQGIPVCRLQLRLRTRTLHYSHAAEEDEQVGAGEEKLITSNPRSDLEVFVLENNFVLEELEPGSCCRTKDSCVG